MTTEQMSGRISFKLNDREQIVSVDTRTSLADALREQCGMASVRVGCAQGECGTCTILLDGMPVRACLLLAVQADGAHVQTAEALSSPDMLARIKIAFKKHKALQCGYCTPGFLVLVDYILRRALPLDEARHVLSSNLCRCTGYAPIVSAVADLLSSHGDELGELQ
jgi:carbon-monoxide dehydrogenase small subunit